MNFITKTNNMQEVSVAARTYFETLGVDLDPVRNPGKALFFNDRLGMLLVRATMEELDIIEAAIDVLNIVPPQVNIKAKFVEIQQDDTKALGFDWYLGNVLMNNDSIGAQAGTAPSFNGAPTAANPLGVFPGNPFANPPTTIAPSCDGPAFDVWLADRGYSKPLYADRHSDRSAIPHGDACARPADRGRTAGSA